MKRILSLAVLVLAVLVISHSSFAQCAMCQGQVESARDAGSAVAEGVNKGVLYIFMMPYLIMGTLGYFWWRGKRKAEAAALAADNDAQPA